MKTITVARNHGVYQTLLLLGPIALFFGLRNSWRLLQADVVDWPWLMIWGGLAGLSAYLIVFCVQRVRVRTPALQLSRAGIEDNISMAKPGLIPWRNIKGSALVPYTGTEHLVIYLKDAEPIIESLGFLQQKMARQMVEDVDTPIVINPRLIRYRAAALRDLINQKCGRKS
ncbi:MAG: STM3941 family protein [Bacteroidota bacterium]